MPYIMSRRSRDVPETSLPVPGRERVGGREGGRERERERERERGRDGGREGKGREGRREGGRKEREMKPCSIMLIQSGNTSQRLQ